MKTVQWIAHRGESIDAPENTLSAFRLAMERNDDGMETDIHLTADGVLLCCHDSDTVRTCGGVSMVIEESTLAELRRLDASKDKLAYLGEKLPTFAESLAVLKPGKTYYVEIKANDPKVMPAMMAELEKSGVSKEQIVVISFHQEVVRLAKEQYPEMKVLWLTGFIQQTDGTFSPACDELSRILQEIKADGVDAHALMGHIDAEFIRKIKAQGMLFAVWTVDRVEVARYFIEAGVDAITSNCAAYVRKKLGING